MAVDGRLVRVCDENPNLVAFISLNADQKVCTNALVLVAGLTDGFMSLPYAESLSRALLAVDYSLVMVNLSSSWSQFGFQSLACDCEEIQKHVAFLKERFEFQNIALLGHSTGSQNALYFLRYGKPEVAGLVSGIILQSGVSDRDAMKLEHFGSQIPQMVAEAKELESEEKKESILSTRLMGAPITAYRLLSLAGRLTDDDMFSTDLTEAELDPIMCCVKVPILLCFAEQDQYVPDHPAQKEFAQRMVDVLRKYTSCVECKYYTGKHKLPEPENFEPFVEDVVQFVSGL